MTYKKIIVEKKNAIAKITLNRPEVLNAMDVELLSELVAALEEIENDDSVNVVILTGAGRAFSAGRDAKAIVEGQRTPGETFYSPLENITKPVIAAVHGYCFTGAIELLMCEAVDIIIASDDAIFGETHARFGLIPGGGQTQRLPRQIGTKKTKELMFTCDTISASEAERIGLVNKVVPHEKLEEAAMEMAEKILKNSSEAIRAIKSLINRGMKVDLQTGLKMQTEAHEGPMLASGETTKRITTFFEKK